MSPRSELVDWVRDELGHFVDQNLRKTSNKVSTTESKAPNIANLRKNHNFEQKPLLLPLLVTWWKSSDAKASSTFIFIEFA